MHELLAEDQTAAGLRLHVMTHMTFFAGPLVFTVQKQRTDSFTGVESGTTSILQWDGVQKYDDGVEAPTVEALYRSAICVRSKVPS